MKLLDRLLLWVLSVLSALLGLLLLLLVLFPSLAWLQVSTMRIAVGAAAFVSMAAALILLIRCGVRRQGQGEAALVNDSEDGNAYVTLSVLSDMAKRITLEMEGVRSCRSAVKNGDGSVDVELELALNPGVAVAPLAAKLQSQLKKRIYEMTGIQVGKVGILVEAAAESRGPKPVVIEQLPPGQIK